jgi:hypothetical protein
LPKRRPNYWRRCDRSKIVAARGGVTEQMLACRRGLCEMIGATMTARRALVGDERLDMFGNLDLGTVWGHGADTRLGR